MNLSRRVFLKDGALAMASIGLVPALGPAFLQRAAFAQGSTAGKKKKTLICVFLRGAADGLSVVAPFGDPNYARLRQNIALPAPSSARPELSLIDLDGYFGLHPTLAPLAPIFKEGHMAVIHACGSPSGTRSHFDAMDYMESGSPGSKSVRDGWLARAALLCPEDRAKSPFRAVALGGGLPRILQGDAHALAIPDLKTFGIQDGSGSGRRGRVARGGDDAMLGGAMMTSGSAANAGKTSGGFEALYDDAVGDVLHGPGQESFEAIKMLKSVRPESYVPASGARYPATRFGESLKQIAQLVKADVGVEIAFADLGGWDTHANQSQPGNPSAGTLANKLRELGAGLAALYRDLESRADDVMILTMSEFGRTARQNGTGGTDHGHATCFFALGGKVNGGKVLGDWPTLADGALNEGRDLALTTDFRAVFGEAALRHLGARDLKKLFPGYDGTEKNFRGIIRA